MAFPLLMLVVFVPFVFLPAVTLAMTRLILRHIHIIIPPVTHEIDGSSAGVIFAAVLAPFFLMPGRYVHVDRLINNSCRRGSNHDGSFVNQFRLWIVSDVNAAIKTGLADTDRHTDIGSLC